MEAIDTTASEAPLCVDLDGTLVKSDTLIDSLLVLIRTDPGQIFRLPFWVLEGKAAFKERVASIVTLDVAHLPYNRVLLEFLEQQHGAGRSIYLATGADERLARRVADHLGLFSGVLASDGHVNLTGNHKLAGLENRFGAFDYIGNAAPDMPLLERAAKPMVANPDLRLRSMLRRKGIKVGQEFIDHRPPLSTFFKAIRVHQWAKNLLIFLPLLLAHAISPRGLIDTVLAFACFSLCASATYIVNDLLDLEADRRHPKKRSRAFASGELPATIGIVIATVFVALAFLGTHWLPPTFVAWLALYAAVTLAYSLYLKRLVLLDVLVLSGLYTLRVLAGGSAAQVPISQWLAAFSVFLFLSLAMVKRFSELQNLRTAGLNPRNGRGYLLSDIEQLRAFGTSSAYGSVIVLTLYISGRDVVPLYHHPERMWLLIPLMIWWLSRVWLQASRGLLDEDPLIFALTNRTSLAIGVTMLAVAVLAL